GRSAVQHDRYRNPDRLRMGAASIRSVGRFAEFPVVHPDISEHIRRDIDFSTYFRTVPKQFTAGDITDSGRYPFRDALTPETGSRSDCRGIVMQPTRTVRTSGEQFEVEPFHPIAP